MPNQQPAQQVEDRMATPAEVAEAQRMMVAIRKLIAQFHETRRRNNEIAAGLRRARVTPDQARMILEQTRDAQLENQAVDALRQYLSILHGREPSRQEMQHGIPNGAEQQLGMGIWPYVVMVGLGAAGSSVYSYFQAVAERERTAQMAMETPIDRVLRLARENTTALTIAGALGLGAYWYHQKHREAPRPKKREEAEKEEGEEPKENPASITERLKAAFGNKKEAAKKNPDIFFRYDLEDFDADTLRAMAEHLETAAEEKGDEDDEEIEVEEVEEEAEPGEEAQEEEETEEEETEEPEEDESDES
jgi:hypothetical protein